MYDARGKNIPLAIPDLDVPEVRKAKETQDRLTADLKVNELALRNLRRDLERANETHVRALAKALREQSATPEPTATDELESRIESAQQMVEALRHAIEDHEREVVALFDRHGGEYMVDLSAVVDEGQAEGDACIRQYLDAMRRVADARRKRMVIQEFPYPVLKNPGLGVVEGLKGPNGDPATIETVVEAVLAALRPPAPTPGPDVTPQPLQPKPDHTGHHPKGEGPAKRTRTTSALIR
jgi:hypothetical protein